MKAILIIGLMSLVFNAFADENRSLLIKLLGHEADHASSSMINYKKTKFDQTDIGWVCFDLGKDVSRVENILDTFRYSYDVHVKDETEEGIILDPAFCSVGPAKLTAKDLVNEYKKLKVGILAIIKELEAAE